MAVRTYRVVENPRPVSVNDLTVDQVEQIEEEVGQPLNQWGNRGSLVKVLRLVLAAGNGADPDAFKDWKLGRLKALANLEGSGSSGDDSAEEEADPDR